MKRIIDPWYYDKLIEKAEASIKEFEESKRYGEKLLRKEGILQ